MKGTVGEGRGYREAVVGTLVGAVGGVLAARLLTVLLVGLGGAGLESLGLNTLLMLMLPPLAAASGCATALRLAGYKGAASSALFLILLSPFALWVWWEAGGRLGAAELWSLRVVPPLLLTLSAPAAHALARRSVQASADKLLTSQR